MPKNFEEIEPIIDDLLEKNRSKWKLGAVKHVDFDDIKQDVKIHIFKKFKKWDQRRPFEPWCSALIHNQIQNKKRNLWRNHEKPCSDCYFNKGMGMCDYTSSGEQCSECEDYEHWESKKKYAYEIKTASSIEMESGEIPYKSPVEVDFEGFIGKMNGILLVDLENNLLDLTTYKIFYFTWIEKLSDEDVARKMGYKTNEKNRAAGYRSLATHRKIVQQRAKEVLEKEDYNFL